MDVVGNMKWVAGLVSALALAVPSAATANILPVGQWDFNEGMGTVAHNDYSFFTGNGALNGGVSWTGGRFRSGLSFDGVNGEVDVADNPLFEGAHVSVSAWVQSTGSPGDYRYIVAKGGNGCCTGSYGVYTGANGGLEFYVASSPTTYVVSPDAGTGVWDGRWHNVIGVFDGGSVRLYVDGQEVGSGTPDSSAIQYTMPTSNDLAIGDYPWCSLDLVFSGNIDEVKVFNRALGPQEIAFGYAVSNRLPAASPFDLVL